MMSSRDMRALNISPSAVNGIRIRSETRAKFQSNPIAEENFSIGSSRSVKSMRERANLIERTRGGS